MTTTQTPDTVERPTVPDWRLSDRFRRAVEHGRVDVNTGRGPLSLRAGIDGTRHFVAARSVVHVLPIP